MCLALHSPNKPIRSTKVTLISRVNNGGMKKLHDFPKATAMKM